MKSIFNSFKARLLVGCIFGLAVALLSTAFLSVKDHINPGLKQYNQGQSFKFQQISNVTYDGSREAYNSDSKLQQKSVSLHPNRIIAAPVTEHARLLPEIPEEIINVTAEAGYFIRSSSDSGKTLAIPYSPSKIPAGFSERDVFSFHYDKKSKKWQSLKRDSINADLHIIYSAEAAEGDFINGIIKAPESPQGSAFVPTTMSGLKLGDPASAVNFISAPSANNQGTLSLDYPISLPKIPHGVQPFLKLNYSSKTSAGWLGEGWNLSGLSSITLDTRLSSPGYGNLKETETYLLDGETLLMLDKNRSVTAARTPGVPREKDRQFYPRRENKFERIIRKGNSPKDYRWIVTDKTGTKYYYGGVSALDANTVLSSETGNISEWKLCRVEDKYGNYMSLSYDLSEKQFPGSSTKIRGISIRAINYSGFSNGENQWPGIYKVVFEKAQKRDIRTLSFTGRNGYLTGDLDSLIRIAVLYTENGKTNPISAYRFHYKTGAFQKTLLDSISQFGEKNVLAGQKFTYYNEIASGGFFEAAKDWSTSDDHLNSGDFFGGTVSNKATSIAASRSTGNGFDFYFGAGILGNPATKNNTVGMQFSGSSSSSKGINTLIDINGDGLPDKVWSDAQGLHYRANLGSGFDTKRIDISGIRQFSVQSSKSSAKGFQANFGGYFAGRDESESETTINTYFADVNADGLIDIVSDNQVYFNTGLKGQNNHKFEISSINTPNPLEQGKIESFDLTKLKQENAQRVNQNPLQDLVRVWEAPFDGTVTIEAPIELTAPDPGYDQEAYDKSDGVFASIQYKGDTICRVKIPAKSKSVFMRNSYTQKVAKNQRIYFRLQSGDSDEANGAFDRVKWQPKITYVNALGKKPDYDQHGNNSGEYDIVNDFLLSDTSTTMVEASARKIDLSGTLSKTKMLDTVWLQVDQLKRMIKQYKDQYQKDYYKDTLVQHKTLLNRMLLPAELVNGKFDADLKPDSIDSIGSILHFSVHAKENIDFHHLLWKPKITYEKKYIEQSLDANGNLVSCNSCPVRADKKELYPVPHYIFSDSLFFKGSAYHFTDSLLPAILPVLELKDTLRFSGEGVFTLRDSISILKRQTFTYKPGQTALTLKQFEPSENLSKTIFGAFELLDPKLNKLIGQPSFELIAPASKLSVIAGKSTVNQAPYRIQVKGKYRFRPEINFKGNTKKGELKLTMYKNATILLGAFKIAYNGDTLHLPELPWAFDLGANDMISTTLKFIDSAVVGNMISSDIRYNEIKDAYVYTKRNDGKFGPMYRGWGQFVYRGMGTRRETAINEADLFLPIKKAGQSVNKIKGVLDKMENRDDNADVEIAELNDISPVNAIFSKMSPYRTDSFSRWQGVDIDLTLSSSEQSSSRLGLKDVAFVNPFGDLASSGLAKEKNFAYGVRKRIVSKNTSSTIGSDPYAISNSKSSKNTRVVSDFMDINGDRYPDIIGDGQFQFTDAWGKLKGVTGNALGVHESKNSGKGFETAGNYSHSESGNSAMGGNKVVAQVPLLSVQAGRTAIGASLKVGLPTSITYGYDETVDSWMDVNMDGLADKVTPNGVRLNLGMDSLGNLRFANEVLRYPSAQLNSGYSISIPPGLSLGVSLANGSIKAGTGMSISNGSTDFTLQDFNGDGLPDQFTIDKVSGKMYLAVNTGLGFLKPEKIGDLSIPVSDLNQDESASLPVRLLPRFRAIGPLNIPNPAADWIDLDRSKLTGSVGQSISGAFTFGFNVWIPFTPFLRLVFNPGVNKNYGLSKTYRQFMDINGDGFPDYLYSVREGELKVSLSRVGRTNLLKEVSNTLKGKMAFDYVNIKGEPGNPYGRWVVSEWKAQDAFSADREVPNADFDRKQVFSYSKGKFDPFEQLFLGFAKVELTDMDFAGKPVRTISKEYDVKNIYRQGNLLAEVVSDAQNNKLTRRSHSYSLYEIAPVKDNYNAKRPITDNQISARTGEWIVFNGLSQTENFSYSNGDSLLLNQSIFSYNPFGSVANYHYREGKVSTTAFDYHTQVSYIDPSLPAYIVDKPEKVVIKSMTGTLKEESCKYNEVGDIEQLVRKMDEKGKNETTRYSYDEGLKNGNLKSVELQNGLRFSYEYDRLTRAFPEKIVNERYGYISEQKFDYRFGVPKSVRDIHDNYLTYSFDEFGRVVKVLGPLECNDYFADTCKNKYTIQIDFYLPKGSENSLARSTTTHFDKEYPEGIQTINFCDGFARAVQQKKTAAVSSGGKLDKTIYWTVSGIRMLDALGRLTGEYFPTVDREKSGNGLNTIPDKISPTSYRLDALDRTLEVKAPDGKVLSSSRYFIDKGFSVSEIKRINEEKHGGDRISRDYKNGSGRTAKSSFLNKKGEEVFTSYAYDGLGQLSSVTDNAAKITTYDYDLTGKLTRVVYSDGSVIENNYDAAGRLKTKIAGMDTTGYSYEFNHLIGTSYSRHPENNIRYYYGTDKDDRYGRDRVVYMEDAAGGESYEYGQMGQVISSTRTILAPFSSRNYSFKTSYVYDSWNRIRSMVYPDGENLTYSYNRAGLLESVWGKRKSKKLDASTNLKFYVERIAYDKFDRRSSIQYGNGVTRAFRYDSLRAYVSGIETSMPKAGLFSNIKNSYFYNNQGGLEKEISTREGGGKNNTFTSNFTYDNRSRLSAANGEWGSGTTALSFNLGLEFDDAYNISSKKLTLNNPNDKNAFSTIYDQNFSYQDRPNQLSKMTELSQLNNDNNYKESNTEFFAYDPSGNQAVKTLAEKSGQEKVGERKLIWDEGHGLIAANVNGFVSHFIYNAAGERTVKLSFKDEGVYVNGKLGGRKVIPATYSLYANPYYSIRNTQNLYTKHIYIGSELLASQLENSVAFDREENLPDRDYNLASLKGRSDEQTQELYAKQKSKLNQRIAKTYKTFGIPYPELNQTAFEDFREESLALIYNIKGELIAKTDSLPLNNTDKFTLVYFYHTGKNSNSGFVTNKAGAAIQLADNLPFGETFVEDQQGYSSRFTYNNKERDQETGLIYYGQRYYDPHTYQWLNTDPMRDKYPYSSAYNFCLNDPVNMTDPNGMDAIYSDADGTYLRDDGKNTGMVYVDQGEDGLKAVGPISLIKDMTPAFNKQLEKTRKYFSDMKEILDYTQTDDITRLFTFKGLVTDYSPNDIKNSGGEFTKDKAGEYSFYNGKLFRYDDYGNYNYGVGANAYGYSETTALAGAGANQVWKRVKKESFAADFSNYKGFFDDKRDTQRIIDGYNHSFPQAPGLRPIPTPYPIRMFGPF